MKMETDRFFPLVNFDVFLLSCFPYVFDLSSDHMVVLIVVGSFCIII